MHQSEILLWRSPAIGTLVQNTLNFGFDDIRALRSGCGKLQLHPPMLAGHEWEFLPHDP
jgi:hypothetical protein